MNTNLPGILLAIVSLATMSAPAVTPGNISQTWLGPQLIPDNDANGVAFNFNVTTDSPATITHVVVSLNLTGGWNGDLYAYLSHGSGFSVLLNRPGRTTGNLAGSSLSGMNLTLADSYLTDVHTATSNPLVGNFAPDGRAVNPFTAVNTDARTAFLSSFTGLDPNGSWTLFFADVSPLAASTIQSWHVSIGVSVVPEPGSAALLGLAGMAIWAQRNRRR